jgi:4-hydroxy-tetrahydrodipicolinate synthase
MSLGAILTAIVTPFDDAGRVDEATFVDLMAHLARNGTDGFVVCGTTGEAPTLSNEEHLRLIELAVGERPEGTTVVAGTGSNDTAHAAHMTERATELGVDGVLSVTPYYNRPSRRGVLAHFAEVDRASGVPIVLYNIPQRTATNMPPDLLAELAQLERVRYVKQSNPDELQPVEGLGVYAGNDDLLAATLDLGECGGICVASHVVGPEMRRMVDEPAARAEIDASLQELFAALFCTASPAPVKAALAMLGHPVGGTRLPITDLDDDELGIVRGALERHGLLQVAR